MTQFNAPLVETELLIVGGGMAGATLAIAAAQAGLEVALIEAAPLARQKAPAFDGRAISIAYGSKRLLAVLDVWVGLAEEAEPILEIRVADGESPLFLHYDHREVGPEPLGWMVEARHLRTGLLERLTREPGIRCFAPARLAALERKPGGVRATLEDGTRLRARLVAACDGRQSGLRAQAGIEVMTWRYRQTGIVCTVAHEWPHRGVAVEKFLPAGPFAALPLKGRRSSIVWTEREDLAPALMAAAEDVFLAELENRLGDHLGRLTLEGPRWSYPLALCHARRYGAERLVLVGDAAHAIHPIAGQGFNLGLRGIAALVEVLADARRLGLDIGTDEHLDAYARWRHADAMVLAAVTDGLNRLFSNDIAPLKLARDLGLAAVNRLPPLKRVFMRHAMGTLGDLPRLMRGEPV